MKPTPALIQGWILTLLLLGSVVPQGNAQAPADRTTIVADAGAAAGTEYTIKGGDLVSLYIIAMPELSRDYTVTAEGTIDVPFLGEIAVLKKTSREVSALVADKLRGDFLVNPQVSATVKPLVVTHRYFIQGAVRAPGVYNFEARPTLLELISVAGGLNATYGATAFVIHKVPEIKAEPAAGEDAESPAEYELRQANINALLRGEFSENLRIDADDIVQIPAADVFFVAGEVRAPGSFALKEGTTLRQAISLAQGTSPTAAPSRGVIFREDSAGQKREIPVDVGDIMKGKDPDIAILANDIIVVPNSKAKSVFLPVLSAFGTSAAYIPTRAIVP